MSKGRPKVSQEMKAITTSIRLRPDRLAKYKELGGIKWLNAILDRDITIDNMFKEYEVG